MHFEALLTIRTGQELRARQEVRSAIVANVGYEWWIDELTRSPLPTGGIIVNRLY